MYLETCSKRNPPFLKLLAARGFYSSNRERKQDSNRKAFGNILNSYQRQKWLRQPLGHTRNCTIGVRKNKDL